MSKECWSLHEDISTIYFNKSKLINCTLVAHFNNFLSQLKIFYLPSRLDLSSRSLMIVVFYITHNFNSYWNCHYDFGFRFDALAFRAVRNFIFVQKRAPARKTSRHVRYDTVRSRDEIGLRDADRHPSKWWSYNPLHHCIELRCYSCAYASICLRLLRRSALFPDRWSYWNHL